ncbi:sigma 54-interacting transcriptional regulator [Pontibacter sp. E15-1]|uniref:sigma 54-interacting transcriptional regulator n=1 Tax=Pontibacter sp. E15-1 TaxID=2919918 RepID=UPI001F5041D6|nr:sigma 54-interacting transcriptional regulator [Pontibacter sp. E15-1]MCJ8166193.1 sigma 54-interacting transcriptional regulator [Pontibacter sp. E15-1]
MENPENHIELWFSNFCHDLAALTDVICALEEAGINMQALHADEQPKGPGIVFFDPSTDLNTVAAEITALAPACEQQIIAVALSALPQGASWRLLKAGATDVMVWQAPENAVAPITARLKYWESARQQLGFLEKQLIGKSKVWRSTLRQIVEMAATDCPILLLGESGTGKELVTKGIHALDSRTEKHELVVVDCTTIVPGLSGSELFGHEKGAFTNAISTRDGAFALANGGSLFLDELGELPPTLQAELLRVLQEGTYKRVGSNVWRKTKFRLISATNRDLAKDVQSGHFRQDLFYRVSGYTCQLPSLRERREDIPLLIDHFLRQHHQKSQPVDPEVYQYLSVRDYPGNVRELQQLVSRIAHKHVGDGPFTLGDIPEADRPSFEEAATLPGKTELEQAIRRMLYTGIGLKDLKDLVTNIAKEIAMDDKHGNVKMAAQKLGCSERTLQMHKKADGTNPYHKPV